MNALAIMRGIVAYIDNPDGKGAAVFARAILADVDAAESLPGFITFDLLAEILEEEGPTVRAAAESNPSAIAESLIRRLTNGGKA